MESSVKPDKAYINKELLKAYFKEFDKKKILIVFALAFTLVAFISVFNWIVENVIVQPLKLNYLKASIRLDIYFVSLFAITISWWIFKVAVKRLAPTATSLLLIIILTVTYILLFKKNDFIELMKFKYLKFYYSDVFFFYS